MGNLEIWGTSLMLDTATEMPLKDGDNVDGRMMAWGSMGRNAVLIAWWSQ